MLPIDDLDLALTRATVVDNNIFQRCIGVYSSSKQRQFESTTSVRPNILILIKGSKMDRDNLILMIANFDGDLNLSHKISETVVRESDREFLLNCIDSAVNSSELISNIIEKCVELKPELVDRDILKIFANHLALHPKRPSNILLNLLEICSSRGASEVGKIVLSSCPFVSSRDASAVCNWITSNEVEFGSDWSMTTMTDLESANPNNSIIKTALAKALRRAGNYNDALTKLKYALEIDPRNIDILQETLWTLLDTADFAKAAILINSWILANGFSRRLLTAIIRTYTESTSGKDLAYIDENILRLVHFVEQNFKQIRINEQTNAIELVRTLDAQGFSNLAAKIAIQSVISSDCARETLRDICSKLMPHDIYWSVITVFDSKWLGEAQVAGSLNSLGVAAWHLRRLSVACLLFAAATKLEDSEVHRYNIGTARLCIGDIEGAINDFEKVKRFFPLESTGCIWPLFGSQEWPFVEFPWSDQFATLLPPGIDWPTISVITPSYNQGIYIEETILSIVNQGYPKLEYAIVDGLSTDDTRVIIEKYKNSIDHILVEKDQGQTDAINKGVRITSGEIVTWINSDDMLAPGALFMAALLFLRSDADLVAGLCLEHTNHKLLLGSRPKATQDYFNPGSLAMIFDRWLKGDFFYQPEVMFRRSMLNAVGGELDQSLFYSMDYDLWMRFSLAGAKVETTYLPVALFRKHEAQKTQKLAECIEEQARVRDRYWPETPTFDRLLQLRAKLNFARSAEGPAIVYVISHRYKKIFSADVPQELSNHVCRSNQKIIFVESAEEINIMAVHVVILLIHLQGELKDIDYLREAGYAGPIVGWFWDNHHHIFANAEVAKALDFVIPGHSKPSAYLASRQSYKLEPVALCITQWSGRQLHAYFKKHQKISRSNNLYGGFVKYHFATERNKLIEAAMSIMKDHSLYFVSEKDLEQYFVKTEEERFKEWCSFKTSLVVPLDGDLSQRFFDGLSAGQIPIVPHDLTDVRRIFSDYDAQRIPIVFYDPKRPASILEAHEVAIAAFDRGGELGILERHTLAAKYHTFASRIDDISSDILDRDSVI